MTGSKPVQKYLGKPVLLAISEPWDFVSRHVTNCLQGFIEDVRLDGIENGALLIKLNESLLFHGIKTSYLLASPRYMKQSILDVIQGIKDNVNIGILPEEALQMPVQKQRQMSVFSFIGSVRLVDS